MCLVLLCAVVLRICVWFRECLVGYEVGGDWMMERYFSVDEAIDCDEVVLKNELRGLVD